MRTILLLLCLLLPTLAAAETPAEVTARQAAGLPEGPVRAAFLAAFEHAEAEAHVAAIAAYDTVLAAEPKFDHAIRRRAYSIAAQGKLDEAISETRRALFIDRSADNLTALARHLISVDPPTMETKSEARSVIGEALRLEPTGVFVNGTAAQVGMATDDMPMIQAAADVLVAEQPDDPSTWYVAWLARASSNDWAGATAALDRAEATGLPAEVVSELRTVTRQAQPVWITWGPLVAGVSVGWVVSLLLLLGLGWMLSRVTLRAAEEVPSVQSGQAVGLAGGARKAYAGVLWLSCVFYYLSLPLVLAAVIAAAGGVILAMLAAGYVSIKLLIIAAVLGVGTCGAIIKSLFAGRRDEDPGEVLDLAGHPEFAALLTEVAEKVGTRPVDRVFITPGTELAVYERGGLGKQLRGKTERCLILGLGVLDVMERDWLRSILAHEYGHFSNRDTAGGTFALAARRSLMTMGRGLAEGGMAAWWNPAWAFFNVFYRVFLRISQGASRLQEVLADRWAAFTYGADAFERGLRHVIAQSVRFDAHVGTTLQEVVEGDKRLSNLYAFAPSKPVPASEIEAATQEAFDAEPSAYDSHPRPADRIRLVQALPAQINASSRDGREPCWSLFADGEALQKEMTQQVRFNLAANHGVVLQG